MVCLSFDCRGFAGMPWMPEVVWHTWVAMRCAGGSWARYQAMLEVRTKFEYGRGRRLTCIGRENSFDTG
jgi:hypothetical protein